MRDTIRQRGTVRMALVPLIFFGWAATAVAMTAVITVSVSTLVPLLVLAAGFEAIFALHLNVERIGRYLQVYHEAEGGWEHVAMAFGQCVVGIGSDTGRRAASLDLAHRRRCFVVNDGCWRVVVPGESARQRS